MGTTYPAGLRACMTDLARRRVPEVMYRYGFDSRKPAEVRHPRVYDTQRPTYGAVAPMCALLWCIVASFPLRLRSLLCKHSARSAP
jgi:hypothetical protein